MVFLHKYYYIYHIVDPTFVGNVVAVLATKKFLFFKTNLKLLEMVIYFVGTFSNSLSFLE